MHIYSIDALSDISFTVESISIGGVMLVFVGRRRGRHQHKAPMGQVRSCLIVGSYALATLMVISGWVPNCPAPLEDQAASIVTQYHPTLS